jgi:hypothetical protein
VTIADLTFPRIFLSVKTRGFSLHIFAPLQTIDKRSTYWSKWANSLLYVVQIIVASVKQLVPLKGQIRQKSIIFEIGILIGNMFNIEERT